MMALFNWFSGKSDQTKSPTTRVATKSARNSRPGILVNNASLPTSAQPTHGTANSSEQRKAKRHARREQLYVAVRESMTRSGVLSASYKFKVLSLDQRGDQFLVMMDVHSSLGSQVEKLSQSELLIVQTAKTLFGIHVTSVYWRLDAKSGVVADRLPSVASAPVDAHPMTGNQLTKKSAAQRYEPIQEDEVAAFKQALAVAAVRTPALSDNSGKARSGLRSYTLITGFEDTEMPESSAAPALSATQYGDLH